MSIKAKGPAEDATTKRLREQAEARAETTRIENTQNILDEETRKRLRRFGSRAALGGLSGSRFASAVGSGGGGGSERALSRIDAGNF